MPSISTAAQDSAPPRGALFVIGVLSVAVAAFLIWLIYFKGRAAAPEWVASLPAANAAFNSLSALCLLGGYINIRRKNRAAHKRFMLSATFFSALFLVSYITYHSFHGDKMCIRDSPRRAHRRLRSGARGQTGGRASMARAERDHA